jgi:hypothetical protein
MGLIQREKVFFGICRPIWVFISSQVDFIKGSEDSNILSVSEINRWHEMKQDAF